MSTKTLLKTLLGLSLAFTFACTGENGSDGADGAVGADGADGAPGADGADGDDGAPGADGTDGTDGADGVDGADGADAACANVPALEITELAGFDGTLYDNGTNTITVVTNAADGASVRLSFAGSGIPGTFTDNGDSSFGISFPMLDDFIEDANAIYSVIATDGCSVATANFEIDNVSKNAGNVRIINLTEDEYTIWGQMGEGEEASFDKWVSSSDPYEQDSYAPYIGDSIMHIFSYAGGTDSPEDHDPESVVLVTEPITVTLGSESTIVIRTNAAGEVVAEIVEMGTPAEGNFNLAFTHNFAGAPEVDLWDLSTGTEIASDLMYDMTYDAVELPAGLVYLGIDVDNDMLVDITLTPFIVAEGENVHFLAVADGEVPAFGASTADGISDVPPATILGEDTELPYTVNYENYEDAEAGDPSSRVFHFPGATSIELTLTLDVEEGFSAGACFDDFIVTDVNGEEYFNGCGEDTVVTINVPGEWVFMGVDSDFSGTGSYQIDAISLTME